MPTLKKKNRKEIISQFNTHCRECSIRACSVISDCTPDMLERITRAKRNTVFLKGQHLLREGMDETGIYLINSGQVKIYKTGKNGRQQILQFARPGEAIGFRETGATGALPVSAMALEDTRACYFEKHVFWNILRNSHGLALKLIEQFTSMLDSSEQQTLKMASLNVPAKAADALCTMQAAYGVNSSDQSLNLQLSRQDIADLAGTTKEQISKMLSDFKRQGLIGTNGKRIALFDLKALQRLAEG